jgi:peptidoglycan/LPS O-acetylase OafA/YrhL
LCAVFLRRPAAWTWVEVNRRYIYYAMAVLFCGVVFLCGHSQGRIMSSVGYTWIALFYSSWLVVSVVRPDPVVRSILNNVLLQQLGILAYGVYIFHQGMNVLLHAAIFHAAPVVQDLPTLGVTALAAAAPLLLAKLSWRYFEKPLVKRGQIGYAY